VNVAVSAGSLSPFDQPRAGSAWLVPVGIGVSLLFHAVAAAAILQQPERAAEAAKWVEMVVTTAPPGGAGGGPPRPPPKAVKFTEIPPPEVAPPPDAPPPPETPRPIRRITQGLSASSFAPGSGTGLDARAGNSTRVAATSPGMTIDEAAAPRSFASVTTPPKSRVRPMMEVPKEAQEAGVEGEVRVSLDIGADGSVVAVRVLHDLGHGTGEACAEAWKKAKFVPGNQDGKPVAVLGVPQVCTVRIEQ
jgi:TonB family protein